jgi:hypothetical protein
MAGTMALKLEYVQHAPELVPPGPGGANERNHYDL